VRRLARFLALPGVERRLILAAAGLLAAVRVGLWLLPFRTVHGSVQRLARAPRPSAGRDRPPPERIVWAVGTAARLVPRSTCLVRALAAQVLLARDGHASQLRLGVARGPGRGFEAHAWVEGGGRILLGGPETERYAALPALDSRR